MTVRRVVTGHNREGQSVLASDEPAAELPFGTQGGAAYVLWGRDDVAHFPDDGSPPPTEGAFPPPTGCRATVFHLPPDDSAEFDAFVNAALPEFAEADQPGMHRTASLDFDVVIEGTVGLELDGEEVLLHPGDVVVQNGTRHRWHNRGTDVAKVAAIIVGAHNDLVE